MAHRESYYGVLFSQHLNHRPCHISFPLFHSQQLQDYLQLLMKLLGVRGQLGIAGHALISVTGADVSAHCRVHTTRCLVSMLNPPLSLLSDDLLVSIVEHVAELPSKDEDLYNPSLADRAFTLSCQKYIFRNLKFSSKRKISKNIIKTKKILDKNPSLANQVRMVELLISRRTSWVFNDHAFVGVLQLLSKSHMPPHELHFGGTHVFFVHDQGSHNRRAATRKIILFANPDYPPPYRMHEHSVASCPHLPRAERSVPRPGRSFREELRQIPR